MAQELFQFFARRFPCSLFSLTKSNGNFALIGPKENGGYKNEQVFCHILQLSCCSFTRVGEQGD
jgi:hypothetical protein